MDTRNATTVVAKRPIMEWSMDINRLNTIHTVLPTLTPKGSQFVDFSELDDDDLDGVIFS